MNHEQLALNRDEKRQELRFEPSMFYAFVKKDEVGNNKDCFRKCLKIKDENSNIIMLKLLKGSIYYA